MNKSDMPKFAETWRGAVEVTSGKPPTDAAIGIAFKILDKYDIATIVGAIQAHLSDSERGRFAPRPADIIDQIHTVDDGRPEPNEAWAIALKSFDDNATVILNDDIASSSRYAQDIYHQGDKVGARMAFIESYKASVKKARQEGLPVKWWPSLGFDKSQRAGVLRDAEEQGLLTSDHVQQLLPNDNISAGLALIKKAQAELEHIPEE
jgi:hypothetical protein